MRIITDEDPYIALLKLSAREALENRKLPTSGWGRRAEANRVEPVTLPQFDVPFQLEPGEAIFTIGSCFARNVESALRSRGFAVPARQLFEQDAFREMNPGIMNNFGVASIANEFGWALDPATPYDFDRNIVETGSDSWVDLHIIPSERPLPREAVVARRNAIIEVTRAVRDSRVVVMTLGLNEVWYDLEQSLYLNTAPHARVFARYPERFELHVLDFDQTLAFMQRSIDLLAAHCRSDQQVILTVSPVPLSNTLRRDDVIVANSYSKSCLRTVAEHVCLRNPNVTYYPSYESVMMSDRKFAWEDDLVHVTRAIVDVNVNRMVQAYVAASDHEADWEAQANAGNFAVLEAEATRHATGEATEATRFFERFGRYGHQSPRLAELAAQHFLRVRDFTRARQQVDLLPPPDGSLQRALLEARLLDAEKHHAEAAALLRPFLDQDGKKPLRLWTTVISSLAAAGETDEAWSIVMQWVRRVPKYQLTALRIFANAARTTAPSASADAYSTALREGAEPSWALRSGLVEALVLAGRRDEATAALAELAPQTHGKQAFADRMQRMLAI